MKEKDGVEIWLEWAAGGCLAALTGFFACAALFGGEWVLIGFFVPLLVCWTIGVWKSNRYFERRREELDGAKEIWDRLRAKTQARAERQKAFSGGFGTKVKETEWRQTRR